MATRAILNDKYMVDEDASVLISSPVLNLASPHQSLCYQFVWDSGVAGVVTFFASVFPSPHNWETLISCEEVTFNTASSLTDSTIVTIPGVWMNAAFIIFTFTPDVGSVGNMSVAQRIVPT